MASKRKRNNVESEPREKKQKAAKGKIKESEENKEEEVLKTVVCSGDRAPVDSLCVTKVGKAHVYIENDIVWDVMLNQTNIQFNNNKFYLIQLLEDTNTKNYSVWLRWGRVGKNGQSKLTSFGHALDAAKNCFEDKFFDKTKNNWSDKDKFVKQPGKYDLLQIDFKPNKSTAEDLTKETKVTVKIKESELDPRIQELMKLICDINAMEETVLEMKYDSKKAPLGKLTEEQITAGYAALKEIEELIKSGSAKHNEFVQASNRFYTRIPHNFGMKTPPVLNSDIQIIEKMQLLQVLSDIEVAMKILNENKDSLDNPIDRHYKCLNCGLVPLENDDKMYKIIEKYLLQSHGKTHNTYKMKILNVFNCRREAEEEQFLELNNKMLLWHGSRLTNIAGILKQGLRIAPPEAPSTGYMFGKGVYFADRSSKSANYCYPSIIHNTGLLLLCEVALGKSKDLKDADYDADKIKNCNSVKGLGTNIPNPEDFETLPNGTIIPLGKGIPVKNSKDLGLIYNEYVVYNTNQIKLKYVIKVKFDFK